MSESRAPRVVGADLLGENRSAPSAATARTNSADHRTSASENRASDQEPTLGSPVNAQHFRIQVSTFQTQSLACSPPSDRDQKRRRRRQISRTTQALRRISEEVGSEGVRRSISSSHSPCWPRQHNSAKRRPPRSPYSTASTAKMGQASGRRSSRLPTETSTAQRSKRAIAAAVAPSISATRCHAGHRCGAYRACGKSGRSGWALSPNDTNPAGQLGELIPSFS